MSRFRFLTVLVACAAVGALLGPRLRDLAIGGRETTPENAAVPRLDVRSLSPDDEVGWRLTDAERAELIAEADLLNKRAVEKDQKSELRAAVALFRQAIEKYKQAQSPAQAAAVLYDLGNSLSLLGKLPEALDALEEARRLRQSMVQENRTLAEVNGLADTLTEIGWIHYLRGDALKAIEFYRQALELMASIGDPRGEGGVHDRLGTAYRQLGRWQEALDAYQQALKACIESGNRLYEAHSLNNFAELYVAWDQPEKALDFNDRALALFDALPQPDINGRAHALYVRSRAQAALGDLVAARRNSEEVLTIVEGLRRGLKSQALSQPFFAMRQIYFDGYLDQLMALHEKWPDREYDLAALTALERSRARGLLETLLARGDPKTSGETLQQRKSELSERLRAREQMRQELAASDSSALAGLEKELRNLVNELAELEAQSLGEGTDTAMPGLDVAAIQGLLDPETLLLSYHLGARRSYVWAVDEEQVSALVLPPVQEIEDLARPFPRLLLSSHLTEGREQSRLVAARLSRLLLTPILHRLDRQRLLVITDGVLHSLPFGALSNPKTGEPLVVGHEIVRVPSASVLAALRRRATARPPAEQTLAIVADPVFSPHDRRVQRVRGASGQASSPLPESLTRSASDLGLTDFPRLPAARLEAQAIAALVPEDQRFVALDFDASRATATSDMLARFQILHFATHGLLHPLHPELSGLVLSLVDEGGRRRDGFLRAHEIANLDLTADLIVLSACRTALGTQMRGEGVLGLPRSLMYAGATRVVVSLWAVDDDATAELMERFYRALLIEELPPAAALRAAQLSMFRGQTWQDPYYWAGFELQGDWR